jgi:protein-S-isoprenylcysteine O-methyltransferase Ste14
MKLRLRVTRVLLLPGILLALLSYPTYANGSLFEELLELLGLVLLILGAAGRVWAGAYIVGRKNLTLVTDGPFSLVRNPLYFFSFLTFVGAGLSFGSLTIAAVFALTFFVAHWPTILAEEGVLGDLFGDEYVTYCGHVPRFIPALRIPRTESVISLDAGGLVRTLSESVVIPLVFVLAQGAAWAKVNDWLPILFRIP